MIAGSGLDRAVGAVSLWMARLGGVALLAAALLISAEVLTRATNIASWSLGTELSSYALAVSASWALAFVVYERAHVRVDVLIRRLSPNMRAAADILAVSALAIVGGLLAVGAYGMVETSLRLAARSNTTLGMPLAWPQGLWAAGLVWFTFVALFRAAAAIEALWRGDYATVDAVAGTPSTDDEVEEALEASERHALVRD
ncbi:TRAP transporter small permease [Acuticoccus sp. M5D2P5]|uniref:TRAP transporter small permease subunit n=1 Tax=Acuticoccus kalidii TaxID=2910977 RepID=UPI001F258890|nr:TRAP transporter small permease [Acuticoccus kalidii]MCF3933603.1 TRAP transporter small permease [Acuticoccus kalidii]